MNTPGPEAIQHLGFNGSRPAAGPKNLLFKFYLMPTSKNVRLITVFVLQCQLLINAAPVQAQDSTMDHAGFVAAAPTSPGKTITLQFTSKITLEKLLTYLDWAKKKGIDLKFRSLDFDRRGRLDNISIELWYNGKYLNAFSTSSLTTAADHRVFTITVPSAITDSGVYSIRKPIK
jgi:hypothetical protein